VLEHLGSNPTCEVTGRLSRELTSLHEHLSSDKLCFWKQTLEHIKIPNLINFRKPSLIQGKRGRPPFDVSEVVYLREIWTEICTIIGASRMTLKKKARPENVSSVLYAYS